MERAIFITKPRQLKYVNERYDRLYFGQEFCERLIPGLTDLEDILSFIRKKSMLFSFVTPYVTDAGLEKLRPLFKLLEKEKINCEIIINDWGVLNLINREYPGFIPVLGRLLTKQKRCPTLIRLLKRRVRTRFIRSAHVPGVANLIFQKKLPLGLDAYYKGSNTASVPIIHNFLISRHIRRIELDNTAQGLFLELPKNKISASLYLPYIYITTTFFCLTAGCNRKESFFLKRRPCAMECQRYAFKLRHRSMPKLIYLKGNTQFYKNNRFNFKECISLGVDRIVYEPEIPV